MLQSRSQSAAAPTAGKAALGRPWAFSSNARRELGAPRGGPARGEFGTGKSAAFGIANTLRVDTVRNGKRNVAVLTRDMINGSDGGEVPVQWAIKNELTDVPNGTTISILDINLERVRRASIIDYVDRHLQAVRAKAPDVAIDDHVWSQVEFRLWMASGSSLYLHGISALSAVSRRSISGATNA